MDQELELDFEWTLEQERFLRECTMPEDQLNLILYILGVIPKERYDSSQMVELVRCAFIQGLDKGCGPLPVRALEYHLNKYPLNLRYHPLSLKHDWIEGTSWNMDLLEAELLGLVKLSFIEGLQNHLAHSPDKTLARHSDKNYFSLKKHPMTLRHDWIEGIPWNLELLKEKPKIAHLATRNAESHHKALRHVFKRIELIYECEEDHQAYSRVLKTLQTLSSNSRKSQALYWRLGEHHLAEIRKILAIRYNQIQSQLEHVCSDDKDVDIDELQKSKENVEVYQKLAEARIKQPEINHDVEKADFTQEKLKPVALAEQMASELFSMILDQQIIRLIDRIAPLRHNQSDKSRFTLLLPRQPGVENIELSRNNLSWQSYFIRVNKANDLPLINRIIVLCQLLGLYSPDSSKSSTLKDLLKLITIESEELFTEEQSGKSIYPLDEDLTEELFGEYPHNDLPDYPYLYFKLKTPQKLSVIRSEKSSYNDPQATENDLKCIRHALTNLVTHTGGIAITFDIENVNKNDQLSLATPSIAVPGLWDQGIKALRKRNKAPKNEQKAAVHNTVGDSLDQTRNDPVDTIIHSIPDVNEAYYK